MAVVHFTQINNMKVNDYKAQFWEEFTEAHFPRVSWTFLEARATKMTKVFDAVTFLEIYFEENKN